MSVPGSTARMALRCTMHIAVGLLLGLCLSEARAQQCVGDCNGNGAITIDELVTGVNISLGTAPVANCPVFDANDNGVVAIDELITVVNNSLYGCPPVPTATATNRSTPTNTHTPSPSRTPTATASLTGTPSDTATNAPVDTATETRTVTPTEPTTIPTSTPTTPAILILRMRNDSGEEQTVRFWGERLSGPPPGDDMVVYGPTTSAVAVSDPVGSDVPVTAQLAPGIWVHHAEVLAPGLAYTQHQQSLVILDPATPNRVTWRLFRSLLTVNQGDDAGDGDCDATCTLRDAILTATTSLPPTLINFDHPALSNGQGVATVEITHNEPLRVQAADTRIDGRDASGNPSPMVYFAERVYPLTITLVAENAAPGSQQPCPCTESNGGSLRIQAADVRVQGVALERRLATEGMICCGDVDLVAFDPGSQNSAIVDSLLDGGARAITTAEESPGETGPSSGKDCVDTDGTETTAGSPNVVENSEIRYCYDRGVKSKAGHLRLERNWIHHNLRGGVFAQSPTDEDRAGVVQAIANLIEHNGRNCPSGDPTNCGDLQAVARVDASELSAQGMRSRLVTVGNVVRGGLSQGVFLQEQSGSVLTGDYVCGTEQGEDGVGILVKADNPPAISCTTSDDCPLGWTCDDSLCVPPPLLMRIRGVTTAYNTDSGVKLQGVAVAEFGTDGTTDAGQNAFVANGTRTKRNFVNALDPPAPLIAALGNQWENCYPATGAIPDLCDVDRLSDMDTNNDNDSVLPDLVDVASPLPHQSHAPVEISAAAPLRPVQGDLVHITGSGFDAISGHLLETRDCAGLKIGNTCNPLHGTCVEFLLGAEWIEAEDVLAVTPTHLVVRAPTTCTSPTMLRVRRIALDGTEVVSEPVPFCLN